MMLGSKRLALDHKVRDFILNRPLLYLKENIFAGFLHIHPNPMLSGSYVHLDSLSKSKNIILICVRMISGCM